MKRVLILGIAAVALAFFKAGSDGTGAHAKTYSLIHAIGNSERVSATGLSKTDCELRKGYLKAAARALTGGSVTCLPD